MFCQGTIVDLLKWLRRWDSAKSQHHNFGSGGSGCGSLRSPSTPTLHTQGRVPAGAPLNSLKIQDLQRFSGTGSGARTADLVRYWCSDRFVRVNGRYSLRLTARRSIGLPYGIYPRLILAYLTTQAVRIKSRESDLGRTPDDLARRLGLAPISGPRGTSKRLHDQLHRLLSTRFHWRYSKDFRTQESGRGLITSSEPTLELLKACFRRRPPTWTPELVLSRQFFQEITRCAVPIDLRAIEQLKGSPLAIDVYIWLTYRMSYLHRPSLIPWRALQNQFGANYARPRDFRRRLLTHLRSVIHLYPNARVRHTVGGLVLYPSSPHVLPSRRPSQSGTSPPLHLVHRVRTSCRVKESEVNR